MSLWNLVYSVHLCNSVRKRTHPLYEMTHKQLTGEYYLSQNAQSSRSFECTFSNSQDSGPSPNPSPAGRGVKCEVTPTGLLTRFLGSFFSHRGYLFLSWRVFVSLTELTDLTERYSALFWSHRRPPAYRIHRTLLPKMAVRFCVIGWLNVSVKPCVFCSSVFFCEK